MRCGSAAGHDSLPQYRVGHLDRIAALEAELADTPVVLAGATLAGVGLPACIDGARRAARTLFAPHRLSGHCDPAGAVLKGESARRAAYWWGAAWTNGCDCWAWRRWSRRALAWASGRRAAKPPTTRPRPSNHRPAIAARAEDNPVPCQHHAAADPTTTTGPATLATAAVTNGVRLPVPADLPLDPYADADEQVIGRISVPRLGLDEPLQQGMTLTVINRGPSHWPGTALPGQMGNVVIAGHRTTFSKPFAELDTLQPGDEIVYTLPTGVFRYRVTGTEVVPAEALEIADQTPAHIDHAVRLSSAGALPRTESSPAPNWSTMPVSRCPCHK